MKFKTIQLLILITFLVLFNALSAFSQGQPPPVDFKRNDAGIQILSNTTPNKAPAYGGVGNRGDVLTSKTHGGYACSAANTGTTPVNILAGVASVSHLVSLVKCYNNTTVASIITLNNNVTAIGSDLIGTNALSNANKVTFDFTEAPILVEGAKPLTFTMTTNSTSTVCCANYQEIINTTPTPTSTPTATPTRTPTSTPTATPTP